MRVPKHPGNESQSQRRKLSVTELSMRLKVSLWQITGLIDADAITTVITMAPGAADLVSCTDFVLQERCKFGQS